MTSPARLDPALSAQIVSRRSLHHADGTHVRAASGLCWFQGNLCMVQDDALQLAMLDLQSGTVQALDLPLRADGARFFDVQRGNKADKPDFESCLAITLEGAPKLLAFGSGSRPNRETLLLVHADLRCELLDAHALYAGMRAAPDLLRNELNVEAAVRLELPAGPVLRLFQRSNGALLGTEPAACASFDLAWPTLEMYLRGRGPAPLPQDVRHYALGSLDGARLTFTDATVHGSEVLFLASAEASPSAYDDGAVTGSVLGLLDATSARTCLLLNEQGQPVLDKAEGIALLAPDRALVVFDPDDHTRPATLVEVALRGF